MPNQSKKVFISILVGLLLLSLRGNYTVSAINDAPHPGQQSSPANYALNFQPGTSSKAILMPSAPNLNFGGDMTIEFWIKTTSTYSGGGAWYDAQYILDKDIRWEGNPDWAVVLKGGRIVFNNGAGGCCTDQPFYSVRTVNDGIWHHVAIVRNVLTGNGLTVILMGFKTRAAYFPLEI